MVETIAPVVHGGSRPRYLRSVLIHTLGAALSAALVGLLLGGLGAILGGPWSWGPVAVSVVAGLYAARELFSLPVPLPDRSAQVPDWWRTYYSPDVAAFLYGVGLGPGFLTYLTFGTYAAVLAGAAASAEPLTGALITAPFGLVRGLSVLIGARAADTEDSEAIVESLMTLRPKALPRLTNAAALVTVALAAALA